MNTWLLPLGSVRSRHIRVSKTVDKIIVRRTKSVLVIIFPTYCEIRINVLNLSTAQQLLKYLVLVNNNCFIACTVPHSIQSN